MAEIGRFRRNGPVEIPQSAGKTAPAKWKLASLPFERKPRAQAARSANSALREREPVAARLRAFVVYRNVSLGSALFAREPNDIGLASPILAAINSSKGEREREREGAEGYPEPHFALRVYARLVPLCPSGLFLRDSSCRAPTSICIWRNGNPTAPAAYVSRAGTSTPESMRITTINMAGPATSPRRIDGIRPLTPPAK